MNANATIPEETLQAIAETLRVLSHPTRLRLIELLDQQDFTVGELAKATGQAPHACSQHLRMMQAHSILSSRRDGKRVYYNVVSDQARRTIQCIRSHAEGLEDQPSGAAPHSGNGNGNGNGKGVGAS